VTGCASDRAAPNAFGVGRERLAVLIPGLRGPVAQRLQKATHNLGFCSESLTIRKGRAFKRESEQIRGNRMVFVEAIRAAYGPFIGDG
jgi:hypothetical protein